MFLSRHNEIYTYDNIDREYKYKNENRSERKILHTRLFHAIRQIYPFTTYTLPWKPYQSSTVSRIVLNSRVTEQITRSYAICYFLAFLCVKKKGTVPLIDSSSSSLDLKFIKSCLWRIIPFRFAKRKNNVPYFIIFYWFLISSPTHSIFRRIQIFLTSWQWEKKK